MDVTIKSFRFAESFQGIIFLDASHVFTELFMAFCQKTLLKKHYFVT